MRRVVSDTGPLLHLTEAQVLDLLRMTGEIHIPKAVEIEIVRHDPTWQPPGWMTVDMLTQPQAIEALAWQQSGLLGKGEADAIALARQF